MELIWQLLSTMRIAIANGVAKAVRDKIVGT